MVTLELASLIVFHARFLWEKKSSAILCVDTQFSTTLHMMRQNHTPHHQGYLLNIPYPSRLTNPASVLLFFFINSSYLSYVFASMILLYLNEVLEKFLQDVPHILNDEQNRKQIQSSWYLLKIYGNFDLKTSTWNCEGKLVTLFFRNSIENGGIWLIKQSKRLTIAKHKETTRRDTLSNLFFFISMV